MHTRENMISLKLYALGRLYNKSFKMQDEDQLLSRASCYLIYDGIETIMMNLLSDVKYLLECQIH